MFQPERHAFQQFDHDVVNIFIETWNTYRLIAGGQPDIGMRGMCIQLGVLHALGLARC